MKPATPPPDARALPITVRLITEDADRRACARMVATTEPWITLGRTEAQMLARLEDPTRELHGAWVDGKLAGFLLLCMVGAFTGYVQTLCVEAEWRGRGVGTHLLRTVEARVLRETPNVFMCVSSFNAGARRLYERLGYQVVGELTDYVVPGHSEILLRKTIGPHATYKRAESTT